MSRKKNTPTTTTVHDRAGPSDADFPLGHVALLLAYMRKGKAMKAKSSKKKPRKMTRRAFRQWIVSRKPEGMIAQISGLTLDAARRAKRIHPDADKTQMPSLLYEILLHDLKRELFPTLGRKPKLGLIGRAMRDHTKRPSGRPPFMPPEKEREWFARVYGAKGAQTGAKTPADLYKHFGADLLKSLDAEISDCKVAALDSIRSVCPSSSIQAITRRIRRARKTFTLDLPKRKSGG